MPENTTSQAPRRRRVRGPVLAVLAVLAAVAVVATGVGLWAFQPWKLLTSSTLDEAPPTVAEPVASPTTGPGVQPPSPSVRPAVLAEGSFVSQEHQTSGAAKVLALPDGSHVLRLEGLASSDGPDLHVWLTDQQAGGDWRKYDDGRYVALGKLKATSGNHNYAIPAGFDLAGLRSVVIWCDRFNVAFGSAPLSL
jgi:Electron transfer DM13